jgi:hypothetical protein
MGCSSVPAPAQQLTQSKSAISAAEAVGSENVPKAALHLKMARDQIATAERLIAEENMEEADLVLKRAEADAELAVAYSREAGMRAQAMAAKKKVEQLRAQE